MELLYIQPSKRIPKDIQSPRLKRIRFNYWTIILPIVEKVKIILISLYQWIFSSIIIVNY
ncbi:hypothetical protein BD408DRAFT_413461 [Parasitella parasitica]|nr:hypothetical protein BD408DRAFT_413461 [Parasitella parasitica]